MNRIALIGYGRFGAALAELLEESGRSVRVHDPHAEVPESLRAGSLESAIAGADLVIVAVPIARMREVFEWLAPRVGRETIVTDVGSVKTLPAREMARAFGERTPWVATHPLFGPTSLATGERPLRVVICPNPIHPVAVERVTELWNSLGCRSLKQLPEDHDRSMALTHALAFFVAKGMIDAGVPADAQEAPPSFRSMAKTIESVRSDAGHLFVALHRENPFAAEARASLLAALSAIDAELSEQTSASDSPTPASLEIPDLGERSPELRETRELIDEVDRQLIDLLSRRAQLARRAARAKANIGSGIQDPIREERLLSDRRAWAREAELDPETLEDVFRTILRFSRRVQEIA